MKKWSLVFITAFALLFYATSASAGGWAVISLVDLPGELAAGLSTRLTFVVRQHGVEPTPGHTLRVRAMHAQSGETLVFSGKPTAQDGYYFVDITLPKTGKWTWVVTVYDWEWGQDLPALMVTGGDDSIPVPQAGITLTYAYIGVLGIVFGAAGFASTRKAGMFVPVLAGLAFVLFGMIPQSTAVSAAPIPDENGYSAGIGKDLFQAKGCVVCHTHATGDEGYSGVKIAIGPDLTDIKFPAEYLRLWLSDPASLKPETVMPNLDLSPGEIENLVLFLTDGR